MARRKEAAHGGGHGWFVTFADLMGLLVAFFVMLVAFSTQDQAKLQVVAGSMRDAFGVQDRVRYSGIIEVLGLPTRPKLKNAAIINPEEASSTPSPDENDKQRSYGARFKEERKFALASASLRQALQEMPEITEASKNIVLEETKNGLNIAIVDQDGRSMFRDGEKEPNERTRKLIQKMAPALKAMPYRIQIVGHTASSKVPAKPGYGPWELSADRANAVRQILAEEGVPNGNVSMVAGKADTEPLFPDNPFMAPNRRVTITLMREEPPIPADFKP
ncbi:MAG: flagellar motor protein MotB [Pseudolabrys sp.]|nr:flagellar motor protein MotB [Pseudolabrys sp.]MBV9956317.1 flagellar motor protein MotB [Pseudolabrys sp.]